MRLRFGTAARRPLVALPDGSVGRLRRRSTWLAGSTPSASARAGRRRHTPTTYLRTLGQPFRRSPHARATLCEPRTVDLTTRVGQPSSSDECCEGCGGRGRGLAVSSNYARLSEGLRLYRDAMRLLVGRRMRQAFPQRDWFAQHVLPKIPPQRAAILGARFGAGASTGPHRTGCRWRGTCARHPALQPRGRPELGRIPRDLQAAQDSHMDPRSWGCPQRVGAPPSGHRRPRRGPRARYLRPVLEYVDPDTATQIEALRDRREEPGAASPPEEPGSVEAEAQAVAAAPPPKAPIAGVKPWRDVVAPHPDVQAGRYVKAEFAADLQQVVAGRQAPSMEIQRSSSRAPSSPLTCTDCLLAWCAD